jgi:hypothetical protein
MCGCLDEADTFMVFFEEDLEEIFTRIELDIDTEDERYQAFLKLVCETFEAEIEKKGKKDEED